MNEQNPLSRRLFLKQLMVSGGTVAGTALLAACGGATPGANTGAATSAPVAATAAMAATSAPAAATAAPVAAATSAPIAAEKTELVHWDWFVTQGPTIDEEIKLFEAANPNITIKKVTSQTDTYADLFTLAQKGGDAPDVFMIPQTPAFEEVVDNGWLADLSQFSDFAAFKSNFPAPEINFAEGTNTINGKTYSAPFSKSDDAMWLQLWVNTKVFKDAGLVDGSGNVQLPETAEDMLAAARTIKEKSGGQVYGYGFGGTTDTLGWTFWSAQLSGGNNNDGGLDYRTGKFNFSTSPAFKNALETLTTLRDEQLILPDSASVDDEAIRVLFAQHKFGMLLGGSWMINGWKKTNPEFTEFTPTHVPFYTGDGPESYFYTGPGGSSYAVSAGSKNAEAAWTWLKWLYSPEAGERWVKAGNGLSVFTEANKPEYLQTDAEKRLLELGPQFSRVAPNSRVRNPEVSAVAPAAVKPGETDIAKGVLTGQITDIDAALKEFDAAKQASLEQAIADAQAAGAKVSIDDFIFADWDPTKDYIMKKA